MATFVEALEVEKLPAGKSTTVTLEGKNIALYNVEGAVYATSDACAHAGSSLGWGILEGAFVKCRAHGLRFDVRTGRVAGSADVGVASYPTKVENGKIYVEI